MVANNDKWALAEDLAARLEPDDLPAGLRQIAAMLSKSEQQLSSRILKPRSYWPSFAVLGAVCGFFAILGQGPVFGIVSLWGVAVASCAVAVLLSRLPDIVQQLPLALQKRVLPELPETEPIREYLTELANYAASIFDKDGNQVDAAFLESHLAIFAFSAKPEFRAVPILKIISGITRYPEQLRTYMTARPKLENPTEQDLENEESLPIDGLNKPLGDVESDETRPNHMQKVEPKPTSATKSLKVKGRHWLGTIERGDFENRLPVILKHWDGTAAHQVEAMLRAAHAHAIDNPTVTKAKLLVESIPAVKAVAPFVGLDGGDSSQWIEKMLGVQVAHPYRFVREILTDPQSDFSRKFLAQERMMC